MRSKVSAVMTVMLFMTLWVTVAYGAQEEAKATAFFPETSYEFSAVLDGVKVVHDFVIQNRGAEILKIERVKTG